GEVYCVYTGATRRRSGKHCFDDGLAPKLAKSGVHLPLALVRLFELYSAAVAPRHSLGDHSGASPGSCSSRECRIRGSDSGRCARALAHLEPKRFHSKKREARHFRGGSPPP